MWGGCCCGGWALLTARLTLLGAGAGFGRRRVALGSAVDRVFAVCCLPFVGARSLEIVCCAGAVRVLRVCCACVVRVCLGVERRCRVVGAGSRGRQGYARGRQALARLVRAGLVALGAVRRAVESCDCGCVLLLFAVVVCGVAVRGCLWRGRL